MKGKVYERYVNFDGGINQQEKPWLLNKNQSQEMQNVELEKVSASGVMPKRNGSSKYYATGIASATNGTRGVYKYVSKSGTNTYFVACKTNLYTFTASGATTNTVGLTLGNNVRYTTFNNNMLVANGANTPHKWTGSASGVLGGSPPTTPKYIGVYQNRTWLANTSSSPSWMWHSALRNEADWTTAQNAGQVYINPDDGDVITGIEPQKNRMLIFKNRAIYAMYGNTVDNYYWKLICAGIGCVAPLSISTKEQNTIFLADDGIYMLAGESESPVLLSRNVRPIIEAISNKTTCAGIHYKNQYRLLYYVSGSSYNNRELILNYRKGGWTENRYQNYALHSYYYDRTSDILFAGGATSGKVFKLDSGNKDDTNNIYMYWKSRAMDFGHPESDKRFDRTYINASTKAGSVFMDCWVDFKSQGTQTVLPVAASATSKLAHKKKNFEQGATGKFLEIALGDTANTTGSSKTHQVYSVMASAELLEEK